MRPKKKQHVDSCISLGFVCGVVLFFFLLSFPFCSQVRFGDLSKEVLIREMGLMDGLGIGWMATSRVAETQCPNRDE